MKRLTVALVALAVAALTATAFAALRAETYKLSAKLAPGNEVPAPKGVPSGAKGSFTGTLTSGKLTWKLTFSGLSGKAVAAHIHTGKPHKSGPVAIPLCGPCSSGAHGTAKVNAKTEKAIESGGAYVNVHTAKNGGGEIRGQIKSTGG